jgi:hypothetical protein
LLEAVSEIGWISVPSPVTPYLALFARGAIARRTDLDARWGDLSIVPGPKGSTWMVPAAEAPSARAFAVADHASREARIAASTTLPARDLAAIHDLLRTALAQPLSLDELRARLPDFALRSLGVAGRKAGISTVGALVLRSMWVGGEVQRTTREGRLDQGPSLWSIDPRPRVVPSAADALALVASRWIATNGPVSARGFANAFGTPAGRALPAIRASKPIDVEIEGLDEVFFAPPHFVPSAAPTLGALFLPARDPLTESHLVRFGTPDAVRAATTRAGTAAPVVLLDADVVATWGFDVGVGEIVWSAIDRPISSEQQSVISAQAKRLTAFVRSELSGMPLHTVQPSPTARSRAVSAPGSDLAIEM